MTGERISLLGLTLDDIQWGMMIIGIIGFSLSATDENFYGMIVSLSIFVTGLIIYGIRDSQMKDEIRHIVNNSPPKE